MERYSIHVGKWWGVDASASTRTATAAHPETRGALDLLATGTEEVSLAQLYEASAVRIAQQLGLLQIDRAPTDLMRCP